MKITSKGQVTIPQDIRERFGLLPHTEVEFVVTGNSVQLRPVQDPVGSRGRGLVDHMRGRSRGRMSTEEIMDLTRGDE